VRVFVDTWELRGPVDLAVPVSTNDPERAEIALRLKLDVRPFVLARPGRARYITVRGAPEGTVGQTLSSSDGQDFQILGVESPYPHLRVVYREAVPAERIDGRPGRQWRIEASLASESPVGALAGFIAVRVDHPRQKAVRIPVSGFVRPIFAVTPPDIALGDVDPGKSRRLTLVFKNFAEEPAELIRVESTLANVAAEAVAVEPGRSYRVLVTIGPGTPEGPFQGTIVIRTSNTRQPTVEVRLTGRGATAPAPER
jgi:hypothetical protein